MGATAAVALAVGLSACTGPNPSHEFEIKGVVEKLDDKAVDLGHIQVLKGDSYIFDDGNEEIHATYRDISCIEHDVDRDWSTAVQAGKVAVGNTIIVHGTVGISQVNCLVPGMNKYSLTDSTYPMMNSVEVEK